MTLLIIFNDDTKKRVKDVLEYDYEGSGLFKYSTLNSQLKAYWAFVPANNIKYFGPEELWVKPEMKTSVDLDEMIQYIRGYKYDDPGASFAKGVNATVDVCINYIESLKLKEKTNE